MVQWKEHSAENQKTWLSQGTISSLTAKDFSHLKNMAYEQPNTGNLLRDLKGTVWIALGRLPKGQ